MFPSASILSEGLFLNEIELMIEVVESKHCTN